MICRAIKRTALGALTAVMLAAASVPAQAGCVPWNSAGSIISQNGLIPGNRLVAMVQSRTGGKVISATLCQSGNNFFYQVSVLGKTGTVTNLTVDARTGRF
jgi:uncharacterized membrane protein YkoI